LRARLARRPLLIAACAGCLVAGLGGGAAYAYFTGTGSGSGGASIGALETVTLAVSSAAPVTPLLPGGTGDATVAVTNPNGFAVTVTSAVRSGTITADSGHSGCTTTGVTFTDQTALGVRVPANSTIAVDLPAAVAMGASSSAGCQGATFSIPVTITARK
jgi:hypothetical protein